MYARGQVDAARPAGSVGYLPATSGAYGLRIEQDTPNVVCDLEIFGGGVELGDEATVASSIPTPGDARGSFTVGARDWQGDAAAAYSSQGPTQDGRAKPEVVAPASTAIWPGIAMVGTSASAPHAAGAAALLMQHDRAAGRPSDPDTIARELIASALDLDSPGPDAATGAGRIRLDVDPPAWLSTRAVGGAARRRHGALRHRRRRRRHDRGLGRRDRRRARRRGRGRDAPAPRHARARAPARTPPCSGRATWRATAPSSRSSFVRDGTQPAVALSKAGARARGRGQRPRVAQRPASSRRSTIRRAAQRWQRTLPLTFAEGTARARVAAPPLARGRLRVRIQAYDEVGHPSAVATAPLTPGQP